MNWSPNLMLAIAKARVKGKSPAEAVARIFANATLELRSGTEEVWNNSTILGTSDIQFVISTPTSVHMANKAEIKIAQVGIFNWFCVRSKQYPAIYWVGLASEIMQPASDSYFTWSSDVFVNTMQVSEIK
jgi:hypothetical protein